MNKPALEPTTYGSAGQKAVLLLVGVVFGSIGAGILASDHSILGIVTGTVAAIPGFALVFRGPRIGVRADSRGITHRALERTTVITWCEIRAINAGPAGGSTPLQTGTPVVTTNDGSTHTLTSMASQTVTPRQQEAAEIRCQELRDRHALHRQACTTCCP